MIKKYLYIPTSIINCNKNIIDVKNLNDRNITEVSI